MTASLRNIERVRHRCGTGAKFAAGGIDRQRPEHQRRNAARADMPQPHGPDHACGVLKIPFTSAAKLVGISKTKATRGFLNFPVSRTNSRFARMVATSTGEPEIRDDGRSSTAVKARPSAGFCPSRRRWQVRAWRLSPKAASSRRSRAATSEARSGRIASGAGGVGDEDGSRFPNSGHGRSVPTPKSQPGLGVLSANRDVTGWTPANRRPVIQASERR